MATNTYVLDTAAGPIEVPVYDPDSLATAGLRTVDPDGTGDIVAFRLASDPQLTEHTALRVGTSSGVYAIDTSTATVLEDFEHGNWPGTWTWETGLYTLTTDALVGAYSLRPDTSGGFPKVVDADSETPRGYTYSMRVSVGSSGEHVWLLTNAPANSTPHSDCYAAQLRPSDNQLEVVRRENGGTNDLGSVSVSLATGTEYIVALDLDTDTVQARVFDATGAQLGATGYQSDSTFSGRYPGVHVGGGSSTATRVDAFKRHPLGTIS